MQNENAQLGEAVGRTTASALAAIQAKEQIKRSSYQLPVLTKLENIDILNGEFDYTIEYYESWPRIEAPLSN